MPDRSPVPLVGVDRADLREGTHLGHIVAANSSGDLVAHLGNPEHPAYFRSCAKPFQALAALRAGIVSRYSLTEQHVAIICASHNGEPPHVETVRNLLDRTAIPDSALQCGAHWPYDEAAAGEARRRMSEPLAIFNNCSGKHAGMLASARAQGASLATYLEPEHQVQRDVRAAIEEFTGCRGSEITYGTDGCSAPNPAVSLRAMARSFAALVGSDDSNAAAIVAAMCGNPFLVGGTQRLDTRLMEVTRGRLLAKGGAAGAHCTADRRSGCAVAVKFESGDGTWVGTAVVAALRQLGWLEEDELNELGRFAHPALRNHRRMEVGRVTALFQLPV